MSLQHEDIWKLLGVKRSKFRTIRPFHPAKKQRNYNAREVFAFKVLLTYVNGHVPSMTSMHSLVMDAFFKEIGERSHKKIKNSIVLWHTTENYIKVIDKNEKYKKNDYRLKPLRLKRLYKDYLYQLGEIGYPVPTTNADRELKVIEGGKN